jgi:hypothetical protein
MPQKHGSGLHLARYYGGFTAILSCAMIRGGDVRKNGAQVMLWGMFFSGGGLRFGLGIVIHVARRMAGLVQFRPPFQRVGASSPAAGATVGRGGPYIGDAFWIRFGV